MPPPDPGRFTFEEQVRTFVDVFPERCTYLDRWIPVIWLECPAKLSINSICRELLRWCGEPEPPLRTPDPTLITKVKALIHDCGVQLLTIDDITRFKPDREADMDASNFLRSLMETSVTFIATGVNIRGSGILSMANTPNAAPISPHKLADGSPCSASQSSPITPIPISAPG